MKHLKTYKVFENSKDNSKLIQELEKYYIRNYTINKDGAVDVDGDVYLFNKKLDKIPLHFGKVTGDFDCSYNELTSLVGCPKEVGGNFKCSSNKLTDLVGGSLEVGSNYYCYNNLLETLEGCAGDIGGYLNCSNNKLTSLDCSSVIGGNIFCRENDFDGIPEFFGVCDGKIIYE